MEWQFILGSLYFMLACFLIYVLSGTRRRIRPSLKEAKLLKGFSILGILPSVKPPLYRYLTSLIDTYGSIFRMKIGIREIIVINNFPTVKKIFIRREENRLNGWISGLSKFEDEKQIILSDNRKSINQRDFITKMLEDFVSQGSRLNEIVKIECRYFLEGIGKVNKDFTEFSNFISFHNFNIISKLLINKRFSNCESKYQVFRNDLSLGTRNRKLVSLFYMMFPLLDRFKMVSKYILWHFSKMKIYKNLKLIFEEELEERSGKINLNVEANDLIHQFFITQHRLMTEQEAGYNFINASLLLNTFQFVTSELDVMSQVVERSLMLMIKYPNIQKNVHDEIVTVIGKERIPSLDDKKFLHYTQAVMDEILRTSSLLLMETFYTTSNNITVDDVFISSDRMIVVNVHGCNTDPSVWERPYDFYPEHFLSKSNNNQWEYRPREELIFYALDNRHFFQESLSKLVYFTFFTTILQRFQVCCDEYPCNENGKKDFSIIKNFIFKSCT